MTVADLVPENGLARIAEASGYGQGTPEESLSNRDLNLFSSSLHIVALWES